MSQFEQYPQLRTLIFEWAGGLAESIEMILGERPQVTWNSSETTPPESPVLWWRQPVSLGPDCVIWIAAPVETALSMGRRIFAAAGSEEIEDAEAKNTYLEILAQSLSVFARSLGAHFDREVSCADGEAVETGPDELLGIFQVALQSDPLGTISVAFSEALLKALLASVQSVRRPSQDVDPGEAFSSELAPRALPYVLRSKTMDLLMEVELPVSISFGRAKIPLKDAIKLSTGSIVELNRGLADPVEVIVNNCVIARGEVVVVDGNYGVRIQQIISREERLRTLK